MSVLVVGMSHRSAPVTILERVVMDEQHRAEAARQLVAQPSLSEAMVVSTCNRLEVYAVTNAFHTGIADVIEVLTKLSGVDSATLRSHLYVRYSDAAAEHLLAVTAGLDSMVVGEQQIIGQVRAAYLQAHELATAGPILHLLAQCALHAGKRVHTETDIDAAGGSMVSFALKEATSAWCSRHATSALGGDDEPLAGLSAVVLGAGAMASLAATALSKLGVGRFGGTLVVCNRTFSRAQNLVSHATQAGVAARAVEWDKRATCYSKAQLIVSACGAGIPTVTPADVAGLDVVCVDLSMPRDIPDAVTCGKQGASVSLINIEKLDQARWDPNARGRRAALAIIEEELGAYCSAQRVRDVVPAVAALRRHAAELVAAELSRLEAKTPSMSSDDRQQVAITVNRIVDKLLHQPTVAVKQMAAHSSSVSYTSALQELFGLDKATAPVQGGSNPVIRVDPDTLLHAGARRRGSSRRIAAAAAESAAAATPTSR